MNKIIISGLLLLASFAFAIPVSASDDDYRGYHGYKGRPYDRQRHYEQFRYRDRRYDYHGHWRSWDDWDHYARSRPYIYEHGHYYRDGVHLMYRFCDPNTHSCIFFSIGR